MQAEEQVKSVNIAAASRATAGVAAAGMAGAFSFVALYDPAKLTFLPTCPLLALTGFACPGCGLTRGFHALFHGDILTAVDLNILLPVWAAILAWVWVSLVVYALRGRSLRMWPTHPVFLWTFMTVLLLFGVIRNIPVYPLTFLYP